jgi:hypothetical protein
VGTTDRSLTHRGRPIPKLRELLTSEGFDDERLEKGRYQLLGRGVTLESDSPYAL